MIGSALTSSALIMSFAFSRWRELALWSTIRSHSTSDYEDSRYVQIPKSMFSRKPTTMPICIRRLYETTIRNNRAPRGKANLREHGLRCRVVLAVVVPEDRWLRPTKEEKWYEGEEEAEDNPVVNRRDCRL